MLMRDGRIGHEQLSAAIEHQRSVGGKLGSILVELGAIDVETLTVYLGLELGIPIRQRPDARALQALGGAAADAAPGAAVSLRGPSSSRARR